jgi:hypothetical protein
MSPIWARKSRAASHLVSPQFEVKRLCAGRSQMVSGMTPMQTLARKILWTRRKLSSLLAAQFCQEEVPMRKLTLAIVFCLISAQAFASCKSDAADKKLAGAALKSFLTKCEKDARTACEKDTRAACEKDSVDKKLHGAAKASHMKKCVADAAKTDPVKKCVLDAIGS